MHEFEAIEVRDNGYEIINAPKEAYISIQALVAADPRWVFAVGDCLFMGEYVYQIVDWDPYSASLKLLRRD